MTSQTFGQTRLRTITIFCVNNTKNRYNGLTNLALNPRYVRYRKYRF